MLGRWLAAFGGEAFTFEAGLDEVFAGARLAELFAGGLDADGFLGGAEPEAFGDAVLEDVEVGVLEFDDVVAVDADEVVVVWVVDEVGVVVFLVAAEVDFVEEASFGEEGECAVEGGAGG